MAGAPKKFLDRILRTEGTISFLQQINNVIGYALGGGALTTAITWIQGTLSQFGFAGYVIIFLVVSILIILLFRLVSDLRQRSEADKAIEQAGSGRPKLLIKMVDLEVAAIVEKSVSLGSNIESGLRTVLQKASDAKIDILASRINTFGSDIKAYDYGPSHKIDPEIIRRMKVVSLDEDRSDRRLYGRYVLQDETANNYYGKIEVDIVELLYSRP